MIFQKIWLLVLLLAINPAFAEETAPLRDLEYARVESAPLLLDLYRPAPGAAKPPLLVWVHGGAWRAGTKDDMPLHWLVAEGFAVASVEYRLSPVARFPAQAHDLKAAIRFLRAHAEEYGYGAAKIGIAGSSAGGHLAALVGVSNGVAELEGKEGEYLGISSDVQAIVSLFGASNLQSILGQSTEFGLKMRVPALKLLLGGSPEEQPALAKLASPVAHVGPGDPPLLLLHGDADPQMPVEQSYELEKTYKALGLPVQLKVIPGAKHGGKEFFEEPNKKLILEFLRRNL